MIAIILFSAAMGWCGTPWPGWWRRKKPPPPPPDWFEYFDPNPHPWKILLGILGGITGGLIIVAWTGGVVITDGIVSGGQLAPIGLAAFAGGRIVVDIVSGIRGSMK